MVQPAGNTTNVRLTCGELLQRYRLVSGLTQEQLADQSGYSADYVGKLERGQRRPPGPALNRFANVLGLGDRERRDLLIARDLRSAAEPPGAPLVGRQREREEVTRQLRGLGPPVLLFSGDPGIGKTRLLEEAAASAARGGWRVIHGGCQPRAGDPYAPLAQAIADSLRRLPDSDRETALHAARHLHLLLPELLGNADTPQPDARMGRVHLGALPPAHERRLLFTAVTDYLHAVAGTAGTLLVLDDLQWAGQDALDLLAAAAGGGHHGTPVHASNAPLRVVGSYRDTGASAGSPVGEFVAQLAARRWGQVLPLEPLADAEAHELVVQLFPADVEHDHTLLAAIVRRAGGIPLFVVSYAEELSRRGNSEGQLAVPWTVAQVVRQRVAALPRPTQELLGVAAMAGRVVQADFLAWVTNRDEPDVLEALEAAVDARVLTDEEAGCQFAHDLIRETIQSGLSSARRRFWHQQIGAAVAELPERRRSGREAEIASHLLQAGDFEQALPWTVRAGDAAAAAFAHVDAERQYTSAIELARELGDAPSEAAAAEKLGDMLYQLGRYAEAIESLQTAAGLYERFGDGERYLTAVARSTGAYQYSGRITEGIEQVLVVIRALEAREEPSRGAADVYAALCSIYLSAGTVHDALTTADKAVAISERTGNLRALLVSETVRGFALGALNRLIEQRHAFQHAARIAGPLGDPEMLATALLQEASTYLAVHDLAEGERLTRQSLEVAENAGLLSTSFFVRSKLADVLVTRGQWAQARREAERADAESRSHEPGIGHTYLLVTLGHLLLLQGERDDGLRRLREALTIATNLQYPHGIAHVSETLAWHDVRDGNAHDAIARLEPIIQGRQAAGLPAYPTVYAWAQLEAGNEQRAAEILAGARTLATTSASAVPVDVLLHSARLAARQRRWNDALADLEEGLAGATGSGLPYQQALLLEAYGQVEADRARVERAAERFLQALSILHELGAAPDAERVEHTIAALPTRPRTPGPSTRVARTERRNRHRFAYCDGCAWNTAPARASLSKAPPASM